MSLRETEFSISDNTETKVQYQKIQEKLKQSTERKWYLDTCPKKMTSFCFVFPKRFLCFSVRVRIRVRDEVRVRVSGNTFKYVFDQTSIRLRVLDSKKIHEFQTSYLVEALSFFFILASDSNEQRYF